MTTIGELIKDLRTARGWSQSRLADELSKSAGTTIAREYISRRWESGRHEPSPFWLRHLSAVLDVPLTVLEHDSVKRRTFLTDVAATAIAPVVASDLIAEGFSARLKNAGPSVDDWEAKLATYGTDYMSFGAADIQRRLANELVVLQQQLDQPRLWSVAARLMTLFAKTFPGSDGAKAVTWYRLAAEAADRSQDEEAMVWVRGRASLALGYEGASLGVARVLETQASAISDKPSNGLLNAVWADAHIKALSDDQDGARQALLQAQRLFEKAGSEEPTDYAIPWWRHNVHISLLAARLGDEKVALKAQEDGAAAIPESMPRFHTHLQMHRGLMMVRAGDRPGGIATAQHALDLLPPEKHSLTLRMLMNEISAPVPAA
ncbi:helix-turn-helix domain-containing protein [Kribbella deserti]|uniref:Helix-turn-helix domain-containing protein n=1 Tax=Kribbella deserti TaxID=1926257 RepID=A0ABV6QPD1_9ACTN